MAKLTTKLTDLNPQPFIAPGVADTSDADLVAKVGAGIHEAWKGYVDADLEGTETSDVSSMFPEEGPPNIAGINLQQITTARKQGRISADMAKVLAQTSVKRASAMQPGRSGEFRQQAASFFGDFSPGQDVLDVTAEERAAAKQQQDASAALDKSLSTEAGLSYFEKQRFYAGDADVMRLANQRYDQFSRNESAKRNVQLAQNNKELSKDSQDFAVRVGAATLYQQFDNQYLASLNAAGIVVQDVMDLGTLSPEQLGDAKAILLQEMGQLSSDLRSQNPLVSPQDFTSSWKALDTKTEQLMAILNKDEAVKTHYQNANAIETAMITQQLMNRPGAASLIMTAKLGLNPTNVPGLLPRIYGIQKEIDEVIYAINPTRGQGVPRATLYNDPSGKTNIDAVTFVNASYDAWSKNKSDVIANDVKKNISTQLGNHVQDSDKQPIAAIRTLLKISSRPDFIEFLKQNEEAQYLQTQYPELLANTFKRTIDKVNADMSEGLEDIAGILKMEIKGPSGTVKFVPAEGLIPTVQNRAMTIAAQYNKNYASLLNDSIVSFAHLQGNKNYEDARSSLIKSGLLNTVPLKILTREQQAQFIMDMGEGSLSNALRQVDEALRASKAPLQRGIDRVLGDLYRNYIEPIGKKDIPQPKPVENIMDMTSTEGGYQPSDKLVNFLIDQEGFEASQYTSAEGGGDTIGYGRKLQKGEKVPNVTEDEAKYILVSEDIPEAYKKAKRDLKAMEGVDISTLDQNAQDMLVEFAFNLKGGLKKFPKFVKAIATDDMSTARKEYERSYKSADGKRILLTRRNNAFAEAFLRG